MAYSKTENRVPAPEKHEWVNKTPDLCFRCRRPTDWHIYRIEGVEFRTCEECEAELNR